MSVESMQLIFVFPKWFYSTWIDLRPFTGYVEASVLSEKVFSPSKNVLPIKYKIQAVIGIVYIHTVPVYTGYLTSKARLDMEGYSGTYSDTQ